MVIDGTTRDPSYAYNPLIGSMIERIGDLLSFDLPRLRPTPPMPASKVEPAR
jgi:hypothetical protein